MSVKSITPMPIGKSLQPAGGWLVVNPDFRDLLALHHIESAQDVLDLPGIVVNGHVGRNVSRVMLGESVVFLKREHRVGLRTRFKNFLAGFGFASMSEREGSVLRYLEQHRLCGADWIAYGERRGEAFLLVRDAGEPASLTKVCRTLATEIAKLHRAGVDQPDLFAKHVYVNQSGRITLLDWQQARLVREVPPVRRIQALAALNATSKELASKTNRLRFLKSYLVEFAEKDWKEFAWQILAATAKLRKRPGIRRQVTQRADAKQLLVRIQGETVCAIPEIADDLRSEAMINQLHDAERSTPVAMLPAGTHRKATEYRNPWERVWTALRGKAWRSSELKLARLVMHLERHGIPAPKIVAYGQRTNGIRATAFVAYSGAPVVAEAGSGSDLPMLVRALHSAGVGLRDIPSTARPFAIVDGRAVVNDPSCFELTKKLSWTHVERANRWLGAMAG